MPGMDGDMVVAEIETIIIMGVTAAITGAGTTTVGLARRHDLASDMATRSTPDIAAAIIGPTMVRDTVTIAV